MKINKLLNFFLITVSSIVLFSCGEETNKIVGDVIPLPKLDSNINKTLFGVDSNNNGVRDDVEIAIYEKYPTNKTMRQISYQLAKNKQEHIKIGANTPIKEEIVYLAWKNIARGVECVSSYEEKIKKEIDSKELFDFIDNIVINTRERAIARQKFRKASDGKGFKLYDFENACDYIGN